MIDLTRTCRRCGRPIRGIELTLSIAIDNVTVEEHSWCTGACFALDFDDEIKLQTDDLAGEVEFSRSKDERHRPVRPGGRGRVRIGQPQLDEDAG